MSGVPEVEVLCNSEILEKVFPLEQCDFEYADRKLIDIYRRHDIRPTYPDKRRNSLAQLRPVKIASAINGLVSVSLVRHRR